MRAGPEVVDEDTLALVGMAVEEASSLGPAPSSRRLTVIPMVDRIRVRLCRTGPPVRGRQGDAGRLARLAALGTLTFIRDGDRQELWVDVPRQAGWRPA